jgi:hypothetical protein
MTKMFALAALTAALGFVSSSSAEAAWNKNRGSGGWGRGGQYSRMFDPKTVETLKGEVTQVEEFSPTRGMSKGVHVTIKTDQGELPVHLGPEWFLERQDMKIAPKDTLEVKGSRVAFNGKPAIIAAEVHKGSDVLVLRDESGIPVWSGWRRK